VYYESIKQEPTAREKKFTTSFFFLFEQQRELVKDQGQDQESVGKVSEGKGSGS
jgi:hypothetical protein